MFHGPKELVWALPVTIPPRVALFARDNSIIDRMWFDFQPCFHQLHAKAIELDQHCLFSLYIIHPCLGDLWSSLALLDQFLGLFL